MNFIRQNKLISFLLAIFVFLIASTAFADDSQCLIPAHQKLTGFFQFNTDSDPDQFIDRLIRLLFRFVQITIDIFCRIVSYLGFRCGGN